MQNQRAHTKTHCSTIVKSRLTSNVSGKVSSFSFNSRVQQPVYLDFSAAWQLESKLSAHFFVYCILLLFFAFRHDNHETIFQITSSLRSRNHDNCVFVLVFVRARRVCVRQNLYLHFLNFVCVCVQQRRHIAHKFESGWKVEVIKTFDKKNPHAGKVVVTGPFINFLLHNHIINIK